MSSLKIFEKMNNNYPILVSKLNVMFTKFCYCLNNIKSSLTSKLSTIPSKVFVNSNVGIIKDKFFDSRW